MKSLFLYTDDSQPGPSSGIRNAATAAAIPFTELRLNADFKQHNTAFAGVEAVIDIDGGVFQEVQNPANIAAAFAAAPSTMPVVTLPPAAINLPVTKAQVQTLLKNLLENPPVPLGPAWTATQRDQASYLLLLGLFKDLQNGTVY